MPRLNDIIAREEEKPQGIDRLTTNQQRSIEALLESRTFCAAAERAGVDRRTIYRWLRTDEIFREEYSAVRRETMGQTTARLQEISKSAAEELKTIIENKTGPVASRISAIRTALDYAYRAVELEDMEHRLVDVEEAIKNHGSGSMWRV
ncbi:MAG: hypothetical protein O2968_23185 [Acidobacteria bacterium]|nr:hypothetical protein [Acidobacteriota bacterium]